ncbi:conserved hypothetical protein, membrane [Beggiatoa sp. PS]|nr:conserved hypothetical protein, membrane [Beggiatoa sp. PS]
MKISHIYIGLFLFALGGIIFYLGYWFYSHFEYVTETVEIGFQGEARDNPLLAAQHLLERMDMPIKIVESLPNIEQDLDSQDTIIIIKYGPFLSENQTQQLLKWVDAGGHLIIVSETKHDVLGQTKQPDPLLTRLQIYRYQNGLENNDITEKKPKEFVWEQYSLQVDFDPDYHIEPGEFYDPVEQKGDQYGTHLLFYYWGSGMISVLSDLAFIENDKIDQYDHAQFLWIMVNFERPATRVWFLKAPAFEQGSPSARQKIPELRTLLWTNAWTIITSLAVLLLFWLWAASHRFGPLLPTPPRVRRRLLEHIEASGHFLWQQGQVHVLLHDTRQAFI